MTENQEMINLIGPLVAKFVVDFMRKFLTDLSPWKVQIIAVGLGIIGAWAAQFIGGAQLSGWQVVMYGVLSIVVNEVGNAVKALRN